MQQYNFVIVSLPNSYAIWHGTASLRIWKKQKNKKRYIDKARNNRCYVEKDIIMILLVCSPIATKKFQLKLFRVLAFLSYIPWRNTFFTWNGWNIPNQTLTGNEMKRRILTFGVPLNFIQLFIQLIFRCWS